MSANPALEPARHPEGGQLIVGGAQRLPTTQDPYGLLGYPTTAVEAAGYSYLDIALEIWRIVY